MAGEFAELTGKLDRLHKALDGSALRGITERVGQRSKTVAIPAISPNSLSGWGRRRRGTVKARYILKSDHEVQVSPTVPPLAALLELGSYKAGGTWRAPKRRGSTRRAKGSVGSYQRANVPARNAWSKAGDEIKDKAPRFIHDEVERVIGGIF